MNKLAFDKSTTRTRDKDGRLHVAAGNPISKATVSPYYGREIPGFEELGLDPDRVYQLLRDPQELAAAAPTFNNIPVLNRHVPVTAEAPGMDITVGTTGSDASFDDPYLTNSLAIWTQEGIDLIESNEQKELSAAYYYTPDMTPGEYKGLRYDGIMRNIVGNHVALVREGRAGPDVVVGDCNLRINGMIKSRMGLLVAGAVMGLIGPKLAQDASLDFDALFGDVTKKDYAKQKATILTRVGAAVNGKLAKDADLDGLVELLDKLGDVKEEIDEDANVAVDDDTPESKVLAFLKSKLSDDDFAEATKMLTGANVAEDEDDEAGEGEDPKPEDKDDKPAAMDEATITRRIEKRFADVERARDTVAPLIGKVSADVRDPSAIYKLALDHAGISTKNVPPVSYEHMVQTLLKVKPRDKPALVAQDASSIDSLKQRFPGATRLIAS